MGREGGEGEGEGEEAPESLFAKELMRRGMASGAAAAGAGEKEVGAEEGGRKRVAAAEFERAAAGADGQRARSMALNSEGLEVRAQSLSLSHTPINLLDSILDLAIRKCILILFTPK